MRSTSHLHEEINRATSRLAQLKARELMAAQRKIDRERVVTRRHVARRRKRLADLVILADADQWPDALLVGVLCHYTSKSLPADLQESLQRMGEERLRERMPTLRSPMNGSQANS